MMDGCAAIHDACEHVHHGVAIGGVKIAGGLVGKDQLWICDQRACDCHSLLLATGELPRHMAGSMRKVNAFERSGHSLTPLGAWHAQIQKGHFNVFGHIEIIDQIEVLEHETDPLRGGVL